MINQSRVRRGEPLAVQLELGERIINLTELGEREFDFRRAKVLDHSLQFRVPGIGTIHGA